MFFLWRAHQECEASSLKSKCIHVYVSINNVDIPENKVVIIDKHNCASPRDYKKQRVLVSNPEKLVRAATD